MATKKKTRSSSDTSADDPVTRFARAVDERRVIAGPHVRAACARHLDDLKNAGKRGFMFDVKAAMDAIKFYPVMLRLAGGEYEGEPFKLLGWQQFCIGSLFGWKHKKDEARRFRLAYIETGKGSGKSPMVAGIGLYGLVSDGEPRAEIYAAATKRDQAMILFRDAIAAVKQSPTLRKVLHMTGGEGNEWNVAYRSRGSFFRPISADDGQSGSRVHMGLIDEIHEHKTANVVEMLRAGTKSRRQALIVMITNAGADREGVCWHYHEYANQVAHQSLIDDSFFAFVCSMDKGDDPFNDESVWPKANPSLVEADLPGIRYLREQVTTARGMPARASLVKRLNFCEWTNAVSPWLDYEAWNAAARVIDRERLRDRRCVGGLDLASTTDLAALVLMFEPVNAGEPWEVLPFFWKPGDLIRDQEDRDRVPYSLWVEQGHIETCPGKAISKLMILQRLAQLSAEFQIDCIAYDRWRIEDLKQLAYDEGIELPEMSAFGQGYASMSPAVEETERLLQLGELVHNGSPVLTWNAACTVLDGDAAGNRKPSKRESTGRIDGIVAMVMAAGQSMKEPVNAPSLYSDLARRRAAA
jgi:phage terminase large subunit-like protein